MKLVGYIRVSSRSQEDNTSLAEQRKKIEAYAYAFGHELIAIYEEVGSGKTAKSRPQFQAALEMVKAEADGIIACKLDRIARNTRDVLALVEDTLKPNNKALVLLDLNVDTSTPTGIAILTVMSAVAALEWEQIRERTQGGRKAKKEQGGYAYGSPAFGTTSENAELVTEETEAATIEIIRKHHKAGKSMNAIANYLNTNGYKTKRGAKWHASTVSNILSRIYPNKASKKPAKAKK